MVTDAVKEAFGIVVKLGIVDNPRLREKVFLLMDIIGKGALGGAKLLFDEPELQENATPILATILYSVLSSLVHTCCEKVEVI